MSNSVSYKRLSLAHLLLFALTFTLSFGVYANEAGEITADMINNFSDQIFSTGDASGQGVGLYGALLYFIFPMIGFVGVGVSAFSIYTRAGQQNPGKVFWGFIGSVILLNLPIFLNIGTNSVIGSNADSIYLNPLAHNMNASDARFMTEQAVAGAKFAIMMVVMGGLLAFVKGVNQIKKIGSGDNNSGIGVASSFLIGGILMININVIIVILANSSGSEFMIKMANVFA